MTLAFKKPSATGAEFRVERPTGARGPVFIVSMMRAGSSLLYALLNQHPQVALTFEAELALLMPVFFKPEFWRDWPSRWEFFNSALSRHGIEASEVSATHSFRTAFETVHRRYAEAKGAIMWGDKTPGCYDRMTWLAKQFPGSSFIVVWRNPADVARSMVRAAAAGASEFHKPGIRTRALLGYRVLRRQYLSLIRSGIPVFALSYEDLVRDTRGTMQGVCEFLQIPFDSRILTLENADRSAVYEGAHHRALRGDKIVEGRVRTEVLDPEWQRKIARYVRLWQRKENGWPPYPKPGSEDLAEPTAAERLLDSACYHLWKLFDQCAAIIFSFAPLGALRRYRAQKGRPPILSARLSGDGEK